MQDTLPPCHGGPAGLGPGGQPAPGHAVQRGGGGSAFVMLGLLPPRVPRRSSPPAAAAGSRPGLPGGPGDGELGRPPPDARAFQEARATGANSPRWTRWRSPPVLWRSRLPGHDLTLTSATLAQGGIWLRYHGDAQEGDRSEASAITQEIAKARLPSCPSLTTPAEPTLGACGPGERSRVGQAGRRSASGRLLWIPGGDFLAMPVPGEATTWRQASRPVA